MEVVLLWLDDLDDVAFVVVSLWTRLLRMCLQIGSFSALFLAACELTMTAITWSPALAGVAAASVAAWVSGALLFALARRLYQRPALARA